MIWIDFTITGLVSAPSIAGAIRGYSQQAFSLVAALAALLVGLSFSRELTYLLPHSIQDPAVKLAIAFIVLYTLTLLLGEIIRLLLGTLLKHPQSQWLDRVGGLSLGLLCGGVWVTAAVILAGLSVLPQSPAWKKAHLLPPFQSIAVWLQDHFPSDLLETTRYR